MNAKINRLTILSESQYTSGRFYEGFFHMRPTGPQAPTGPVVVSDGYVGLTIAPRLPGNPAQLHSFGIEVDDPRAVVARLREHYPDLEWLDRPAGQPDGAVAVHDPCGSFVIVTPGGNMPTTDGRKRDRVVDHIALRVLRPEAVAAFYAKVFDLTPIDGPPSEQKNLYLSDGRVTLMIVPWKMNDFLDTGISARGMDHIGFKVESLAALKADIARITEQNYRFQPRTSVVGRGKEGGNRLAMFRRICPLGCHHMSDSDGFWLDARE